MNILISQIKKNWERIKPYKWLLLPIVPAIILIFYVFYLIFTPLQPNQLPNQNTIQPSPSENENSLIIPEDAKVPPDAVESFDSRDVTLLSEYQKTDSLSDGTTIHSFDSGKTNRPNLLITNKSDVIVFSRSVFTQEGAGTIETYKNTYGDPEKVIQGSTVYGNSASIFINASLGITYIGDPKTGKVYEEQLFNPMSVDEYLQTYGDQN